MKYKVGDKVKLRNDLIVGKNYGNIGFLDGMTKWLNKQLTIDSINYDRHTFESKETDWYFSFEMIRECTKEYTWEDFKKCPLGTKVTFEDGTILIKYGEISNQFGDREWYRDYEDLKGFKDNVGSKFLGKIIKIEEPTYTTVYEPKKVTMPEIEEMKRLTDELYKICDEVIKNYEDKGDGN